MQNGRYTQANRSNLKITAVDFRINEKRSVQDKGIIISFMLHLKQPFLDYDCAFSSKTFLKRFQKQNDNFSFKNIPCTHFAFLVYSS